MTPVRRILINLSELMGAEYGCSHCHTRCFVSFEEFKKIPVLCPNCEKRWFGESQPSNTELSDVAVVSQFVEYLRKIKAHKFNAIVRLEIASDVRLDVIQKI
jgi:DNA-directed RNA polymerase subunit RPC12/RpoP